MIPQQPFGRTGHDSTRIIFGAAALWRPAEADAGAALESLLEHGINHIDVAASYGDAELWVGRWMERHRDRFFLATKTIQRTYQSARDEIRRSLERLRTSYVDLIQLHNLTDEDGWQAAFAPGGALEAAVEARDQGLVRFIGVTGHGTQVAAMHRRSLERFPFDSVLLPLNWPMMQNPAYAADFQALAAACREREIAVQTIKGLTMRPWGEHQHTTTTWYEPVQQQADVDRAVWWVLGHPGVFLNSASDVHLLPKILDAASRFRSAPSDEEMAEMARRLEMAPLFT